MSAPRGWLFEVPGDPQAWARAGHTVRNGPHGPYVHTYEKAEAASEKERVAVYALVTRRSAGLTDVLQGAVGVEIIAVFRIPTKRAKTVVPGAGHTDAPDADNVGKLVLDALRGVAYADDRQVSRLSVEKRWAASGVQGSLSVRVTECG